MALSEVTMGIVFTPVSKHLMVRTLFSTVYFFLLLIIIITIIIIFSPSLFFFLFFFSFSFFLFFWPIEFLADLLDLWSKFLFWAFFEGRWVLVYQDLSGNYPAQRPQ